MTQPHRPRALSGRPWPHLAEILGLAFYTGTRLLTEVHTSGLEHFRQEPSTLLVINHKRDLDVVVAAPHVYFHRRLRRPRRLPHFVAREDMFLPGFLGAYPDFPRWVRRLLCPVNLAPVLRRLGAAPIRRFPERTLRELLLELGDMYGDAPIASLFAREALTRWPAWAARVPVRAIARRCDLAWLRGPARLVLLNPDVRPRVIEHQRETVTRQLDHFVEVLDAGGIVYLAPEGVLSPDGRLGRLREAFDYLAENARVPARILPLAISYDFMATGRLCIHLAGGAPIEGVAGLPPDQRTAAIRRTLAGLVTITTSQVAGAAIWDLVQKGARDGWAVDHRALAGEVLQYATRLMDQGVRVDPRVADDRWYVRRWDRLITFGQQRGLWRHDGGTITLNPQALLAPGRGYREDPVRYAARELESVLLELGVGPSCREVGEEALCPLLGRRLSGVDERDA